MLKVHIQNQPIKGRTWCTTRSIGTEKHLYVNLQQWGERHSECWFIVCLWSISSCLFLLYVGAPSRCFPLGRTAKFTGPNSFTAGWRMNDGKKSMCCHGNSTSSMWVLGRWKRESSNRWLFKPLQFNSFYFYYIQEI